MPDPDKDIFFSPSGRYAARQAHCQRYKAEDCNKRSVHFIDFEEETYTDITLVIFKYYYIPFMYWIDDSHIAVLLSQYTAHAEKNTKGTHRPKMALYEVDFITSEWTPKKIVYQKKNEKNIPEDICFHVFEGYLTVNDQDYLIFTKGWGNMQDPTLDPEYNDLEKSIVYNEDKKDYFWLRFIPKQFENQKQIEKMWINQVEALKYLDIHIPEDSSCSLVARAHKLYTICPGIEVMVMDINKYYNIIKKEKRAPLPAEFCTRVTIPTSFECRMSNSFCHGAFVYMTLMVDQYSEDYYITIWDLDNKRVAGDFLVDRDFACEEEGHRWLKFSVHPSGHILQRQHNLSKPVFNEQRHSIEIITNELFKFNFLPLKPIREEVESLQKLSRNREILNRTINGEKLPRCLREG